jgi:biotin transport system substrate-specific component
MILCSIFAALTAVGAFIRIPMPYFDYITLQTTFVLLAGMLLGARRGAIALLVYVLIGLSGIPLFAGGGGFTYVLRASFGFLIGFILGAGMTGLLTEAVPNPGYLRLFLAGLSGLVVVYTCGILYRYFIMNYYLDTPLSLGIIFAACLPVEIPKDILVCAATAYFAKKIRPRLIRN